MDEENILKLQRDLPFLTGLTGLATKWKEVGDHLGVCTDQLDAIQHNNQGSVDLTQNCLRDMFIWWLRNGKETTIKKLMMAVRAIGRRDVEKEINQKYGILHTVDQSPSVTMFDLPVNIQRYCRSTKTRYRQQSVLPESDWPPSLGGQYIRLALISQGRSLSYHRYENVIEQQKDYTRGDYDKILEYKTRIELEKAFGPIIYEDEDEIKPLKMLIDGAPGVGKTTLSRKVSRMWAEGELLKQYWLVLLLHLRESAISKAKTIDEFFYHEDSDLLRDVVKFVKEGDGSGVLIIFDGFDELNSYERSQQSLFLDVSRGKILPKCAVVITSRPYASRSLQELPLINRHIEVLGFTDEQVKMCIKLKIKNEVKAEELCMELKDRLDIASICQIPLNCSIVLYVYEQEGHHLPRTLTELYTLFVLHSLKRFIKRTQNSAAADRLTDLKNLERSRQEILTSLCKLAYEGLKDDKLVFSRNDMEAVLPLECQETSVDVPVLDLMTSAKSYSSRGAQDTYSFLHLTIQEFLGAYWIAHHLTDDKKLQFFQQNLKKNRFRMVLIFLSGMTELDFSHALSIFDQISWDCDIIHACHLLYESGNIPLCKSISEKHFSLSKIVKTKGSRFDVLVVSHFVAYSENQWDGLELRSDDVTVVNKVFSSCPPDTSIQTVTISFENNDNDLELLESILEKVRKVLMGPYAIRTNNFTIVLKYIRGTRSRQRNSFLTRFCKTLAECLANNSSITKIILNCVSAEDVRLIFTRLSKSDSISNLTCIVCIQNLRKRPAVKEQTICKQFCTSLATYISKNKSLQSADLDIPLDSSTFVSHIELLKSALANNTILQTLSICKGKILFMRNKDTKNMEVLKVPKPTHALPSSLSLSSLNSPAMVHHNPQTCNRFSISPHSSTTLYPMMQQIPHGIPSSYHDPLKSHAQLSSSHVPIDNPVSLNLPAHLLSSGSDSQPHIFPAQYSQRQAPFFQLQISQTSSPTANLPSVYPPPSLVSAHQAQTSIGTQYLHESGRHAQPIPCIDQTQSISSPPAKRPCAHSPSLITPHQVQASVGVQHSFENRHGTHTLSTSFPKH